MQIVIALWSGERTRLGCWRRRPAAASEALGGDAEGSLRDAGAPRTSIVPPIKPKQASGYRTQSEWKYARGLKGFIQPALYER